MAKFNITVDLDWCDPEGEYSIDEELRERIIENVEEILLKKSADQALEAVNKCIEEKIEEVSAQIDESIDSFIQSVCEKDLSSIVIPYKCSDWSSKVVYIPISEYIGKRFESFLNTKKYNKDGEIASWSSDACLSPVQLMTERYLEKQLGPKIETMIANAKREVEENLIKSLESKLKENLAKDMIEKMNIPDVLRRLNECRLEDNMI